MTRLEAGDAALARGQLLAHGDGPQLTRVPHSDRAHWFGQLALSELAAGDREAAARWVEAAEAAAAAHPLDGQIAAARYARAAVELAGGRASSAAPRAHEARRRYGAAGRPIDGARAEVLTARALAALGKDERATDLLRHAHAEFERCGCARYRDEAASELRRLGHRPTRPEPSGSRGARIDELSSRERDVAELVARGMTNRQIAEPLYLSPKTIETHLSRAYYKLGISSRAALAVAIERAPRA